MCPHFYTSLPNTRQVRYIQPSSQSAQQHEHHNAACITSSRVPNHIERKKRRSTRGRGIQLGTRVHLSDLENGRYVPYALAIIIHIFVCVGFHAGIVITSTWYGIVDRLERAFGDECHNGSAKHLLLNFSRPQRKQSTTKKKTTTPASTTA